MNAHAGASSKVWFAQLCAPHGDHYLTGGIEMKKPKVASITRAVLAVGSVFFVLTIALTTATMTPLSEGFEAGGKTAYAAGNVTLGTGSWYMDDALTGNLSTDHKT